jgi:glycosyltransferase involved in cell wall biosynthesis
MMCQAGIDMNPMTLSVCMATYNGSRFIKEQLESILGQLLADEELIISDDGSTDDTLAVISEFNDPRLRLLKGRNFKSPIRNFEYAIQHADGEIIVLADQDDIWQPGRLDLVRKKLAPKIGSIALLMMDAELIDATGDSLGNTLFAQNRVGAGLIKNVYNNTYTGCCLAFTRQLRDVSLPFPNRLPMHDMWLGLLAELCGTVEFAPQIVTKYRRHGNNTSFVRAGVVEQVRRRVFLVIYLLQRYRLIKRGVFPQPNHKS